MLSSDSDLAEIRVARAPVRDLQAENCLCCNPAMS